jgi:hypothetical protein
MLRMVRRLLRINDCVLHYVFPWEIYCLSHATATSYLDTYTESTSWDCKPYTLILGNDVIHTYLCRGTGSLA